MAYGNPEDKAKWTALNRDRLLAGKKQWYQANRARILSETRHKYEANENQFRDKSRKAQALYCSKHKSDAVERVAKWRLDNPDKYQQQLAEAKRRNVLRKEVKRISAASYYCQNTERTREAIRRWQADNPEKHRAIKLAACQRRRARLRDVGGFFTASDVQALLAVQQGKCAGCCVDIRRDYSIDHVMPLSRGGRNDGANIQLLCLLCNMRKRAMHPEEWAAKIGKLFV